VGGQTEFSSSGDILAKFAPKTDTLGAIKYRCQLSKYGGNTDGKEVANTVEIIGW
jgi:hypothetical protein